MFKAQSLFFLICCFFLMSRIAHGQITASNNLLPPVIPPSPNAVALGKYGDVPVSNYTGTPNISIPLYEIKLGTILVPVSLTYHSSGNKVEEEASWVGLGWALDAGGVVTRSSVGKDDNAAGGYFSSPAIPDPTSATGTVLTSGLHEAMLKDIYCMPTVNGQVVDYSALMSTFSSGSYDEQPDRYYFNFAGASGKFVLKKDKTAVLIDQQKVKIEYLSTGWKITNAKGLIFEFTDK